MNNFVNVHSSKDYISACQNILEIYSARLSQQKITFFNLSITRLHNSSHISILRSRYRIEKIMFVLFSSRWQMLRDYKRYIEIRDLVHMSEYRQRSFNLVSWMETLKNWGLSYLYGHLSQKIVSFVCCHMHMCTYLIISSIYNTDVKHTN